MSTDGTTFFEQACTGLQEHGASGGGGPPAILRPCANTLLVDDCFGKDSYGFEEITEFLEAKFARLQGPEAPGHQGSMRPPDWGPGARAAQKKGAKKGVGEHAFLPRLQNSTCFFQTCKVCQDMPMAKSVSKTKKEEISGPRRNMIVEAIGRPRHQLQRPPQGL